MKKWILSIVMLFLAMEQSYGGNIKKNLEIKPERIEEKNRHVCTVQFTIVDTDTGTPSVTSLPSMPSHISAQLTYENWEKIGKQMGWVPSSEYPVNTYCLENLLNKCGKNFDVDLPRFIRDEKDHLGNLGFGCLPCNAFVPCAIPNLFLSPVSWVPICGDGNNYVCFWNHAAHQIFYKAVKTFADGTSTYEKVIDAMTTEYLKHETKIPELYQ